MISGKEKERYERQIRIEELGINGQEKLKNSKVLIAGAGGLGSPVAMYLAAAGIGTIRLADYDVVNMSNLNRQILYQTKDIGKLKVEAAKKKLEQLNQNICVQSVPETITADNVYHITNGCDIIVDATDNFIARYVLNKAALKIKIPFLYGGIYGLEGALTTIIPGETACLRCTYKNPPPGAAAPAPVLGVTAGTIGCLQALEAIKYIVGTGKLLANRMLLFDGISMDFREIILKRNPECPDCSLSSISYK